MAEYQKDVVLEEEDFVKLYKMYHKINADMGLLTRLLNEDMASFTKLFDIYVEDYKKYEDLKNYISEKYRPVEFTNLMSSWSADFEGQKVVFYATEIA